MRVFEKRPFVQGPATYQGSCHCGAVRFEVEIDLSKGTTRCNCTYCTKLGHWGVLVKPAAFRLLAGEVDLLPGKVTAIGSRPICRHCAVGAFSTGSLDVLGGDFVGINVRCLDDVDLTGVPVTYLDGLHDTWATLEVRPWVDPMPATPAAA